MNIEIEKQSDHYRADCKDLPGSPPVGIGKTIEEAMAHLFWRILFDYNISSLDNLYTNIHWYDYIKRGDDLIVNGKKWELPESYKRE